MGKTIIMTVSTDLVNDQRVKKVCDTLHNMDFRITLVGRKLKNSPPMDIRPYTTKRLPLVFSKGKLFYAEMNIRLFFYLLFHKCDIYHANDLDTLLPNVLISRLKRKPLIYDSHEYFTEVAELVTRPFVQRIWKRIERYCIPKVDHMFTVCPSIAGLYQQEYHRQVDVMRNIPPRQMPVNTRSRRELHLPEDRPVLILQGTGINIHRGSEELVEAMQYIPQALLLVIGDGDVIPALKQMSKQQGTSDRLLFMPRMPFEELYHYTANADIGFSLDKNISINHLYALPNKLFDYIRAQIPVIASPMIEIARIIQHYHIGIVIDNIDARTIAQNVNTLLADPDQIAAMKHHLQIASQELCWENEAKSLQKVYEQYC